MFTTRRGKRLGSLVALGVVVLLVGVGALWWVFRDLGAKRVTAFFNDAVGGLRHWLHLYHQTRTLPLPVGDQRFIVPPPQRWR